MTVYYKDQIVTDPNVASNAKVVAQNANLTNDTMNMLLNQSTVANDQQEVPVERAKLRQSRYSASRQGLSKERYVRGS